MSAINQLLCSFGSDKPRDWTALPIANSPRDVRTAMDCDQYDNLYVGQVPGSILKVAPNGSYSEITQYYDYEFYKLNVNIVGNTIFASATDYWVGGSPNSTGLAMYGSDSPSGLTNVAYISGVSNTERQTPIYMSKLNGKRLYAVYNGYLYVSPDSSSGFVQQTAPGIKSWMSVCGNSTGNIMYACANGDTGVWKSTDFGGFGDTWSFYPTPYSPYCMDCSADGSKVVVSCPGFMMISHDGGSTWFSRSTPGLFGVDVRMSASGEIIIVGGNPSDIWTPSVYISTNSGVSWKGELVGYAAGQSAGIAAVCLTRSGSTFYASVGANLIKKASL